MLLANQATIECQRLFKEWSGLNVAALVSKASGQIIVALSRIEMILT